MRDDLELQGVSLLHYTFDADCKKTGEEGVISFSGGKLKSGQSIKVHSGKGSTEFVGEVYHFSLNRERYIWNNKCGDYAVLRRAEKLIDWAMYDPNPPENTVLRRREGTNKLVPQG